MLRRNKEWALGSLAVFGITERAQSPWPSQVPASWQLPSSRQLGLDHSRELEASGVLYLKTSNLSGCRLEGRWRDKGSLSSFVSSAARCWHSKLESRGPEGLTCGQCVSVCVSGCMSVCVQSHVLCSASGTLQSSACATMHWGQDAKGLDPRFSLG